MSWEEMCDKWGEPQYGEKYFCQLNCHSNKEICKYMVLDFVNESDHSWQFNGEELSNNWYHEYWISLDLINKVIKNQMEEVNGAR